jgi:hypothetical protein
VQKRIELDIGPGDYDPNYDFPKKRILVSTITKEPVKVLKPYKEALIDHQD